PPDTSTLSLHDALPISLPRQRRLRDLHARTEHHEMPVRVPFGDRANQIQIHALVDDAEKPHSRMRNAGVIRGFLGDGAGIPHPRSEGTRLNSSHLVISY